MIIDNKLRFGIFFLIGILFLSGFVLGYSRANPNYGLFDSFVKVSDVGVCQAGQDFALQIAPFGCTPAVVRSDLLEEQNVPVFCQVAATKLNPLIDVEAIEGVSFSGEYPLEVSGVGFHPARAALGISGDLNSPILNNIGYVVIVLKKQKNESSMPEFVTGNLTAKIRYDIQNAFGIGKANFYLPEISDSDFESNKYQYGFWNGKGYLRAEGIDEGGATISIYDDTRRITGVNLDKGETSRDIFLPSMDSCLASLRLRLDGLEDPDTRVRLDINGEYVEVTKGEKFLENKCQVRDIEKQGLNQKVSLSCNTYEKRGEKFDLRISPKVKLDFPGANPEGYAVGEKIPFSDDPSKQVYLGFIGAKDSSSNEDQLYVRFVQTPDHGSVLSEGMLNEIARYDRASLHSQKGSLVTRYAATAIETTAVWIERFARYLVTGDEIRELLEYGVEDDVYGTNVKLIGFADPVDRELKDNALKYYGLAKKDYETLVESFPSTKEESFEQDYGERALLEDIRLAKALNQRKTMSELCGEFRSRYPESDILKNELKDCDAPYKDSNIQISTKEVSINGEIKGISFEGIYEPTLEEYSAEIRIDGKSYILRKNQVIYLEGPDEQKDFLVLKEVHEDYALFDASGIKEIVKKETFWKTNYLKINLKDFSAVGQNNYRIYVDNINLKKSVKVSVIPNVNNVGTEATFGFKIGIEKRSIQLSPEKTREKIDNINETINEWEDKSEKLGNVIQGLKGACLATGTFLTVKNLFANAGGKAIARGDVMRTEGGWNDRCADLVSGGEYNSPEECFTKEADNIDRDVDEYYSAMNTQNDKLKTIQEPYETSKFLTETYVDTDKFKDAYLSKRYKSELSSNLETMSAVEVGGKSVEVSKILGGLDSDAVSVEQLRSLELNSKLLNSSSPTLRAMTEQNVKQELNNIYVNTQSEVIQTAFSDELNNQQGLSGVGVRAYAGKDSITGVYDGGKSGDAGFGGIAAGASVQAIIYNNNKYLLELENTEGNEYIIKDIYDANGVLISEEVKVNEITNRFSSFKQYDTSTYRNEYKNPELSYYETEPYKGLPAIVPFNLNEGWYVSVEQTLPVLGNIQSYDESGRVMSFWLCNIGENGREENKRNDDVCEQINLGTGQAYNQFPGLGEDKAHRVIQTAVKSVEQASKLYKPGLSGYVNINGQKVKVGAPTVDIPEMQCTNFMSPKECQLLFNVCDPVVCPSSRCDFGGAYPVRDVIQSGIIGSLALCLPNIQEGIYIPVCLTGIKAGIDSLLSVFKSHRDCLQESLDSGEMTGICDEIYSVHLCEFFWRQSLPLAQIAIPKVMEWAMGQNAHGGGEYMGVASAWQNAEDSVTYFTQYYAANSYQAFKARVVEGVGDAVCQSSISASYPAGGNLLDSLTEPDSPPQFHGRFDEIPFTSATVPPISHYKTFYHIYAGKDSRAYYSVYLKGDEGSSFYQDVGSRRDVASGYIGLGEYASETKDFTAPAGYKELCINVNGQEECGFKQVSTSFAVDYVTDKYMEEQTTKTGVTTEKECVSGSASVYSLLNPNLQSAGEEMVDPKIYNRGIIRVCASESPGMGSDPKDKMQGARWVEVGYCGDKKMKCWLDTESIENAVDFDETAGDILKDVSDNYLDKLSEEGNYIQNFETELQKIEGENDSLKKISSINNIIGKVFWDYEKAKLFFLRGQEYGRLAQELYEELKKEIIETPELTLEEKITCNNLCLEYDSSFEGGVPVIDEYECGDGEDYEFIEDIITKCCCYKEIVEEDLEDTKNIVESLVDTPVLKKYVEQLTGDCTSYQCIAGSSVSSGLEVVGGRCHLEAGKKIMEIAKNKKTSDTMFSDETVYKNTGVKNFECLVVQQAMQESCLAHCVYDEEQTNYNYCDGNLNSIVKGDADQSIGIMQLNNLYFDEENSIYFDQNVNEGIDHLIGFYSTITRSYSCTGKNYDGWQRALRHYNGWPTSCAGDPEYVESVLAKKSQIEQMFPEECGTGVVTKKIVSSTVDENVEEKQCGDCKSENWFGILPCNGEACELFGVQIEKPCERLVWNCVETSWQEVGGVIEEEPKEIEEVTVDMSCFDVDEISFGIAHILIAEYEINEGDAYNIVYGNQDLSLSELRAEIESRKDLYGNIKYPKRIFC